MKKALRLVLAAIVAVMLVGVSPVPHVTSRVQWDLADVEWPGGG